DAGDQSAGDDLGQMRSHHLDKITDRRRAGERHGIPPSIEELPPRLGILPPLRLHSIHRDGVHGRPPGAQAVGQHTAGLERPRKAATPFWLVKTTHRYWSSRAIARSTAA